MSEKLADLASQLNAEFSQAQTDREPLERRWLEDYRIYKGIYDETVRKRIKKGKSKIFLRKVKVKTDTVVARLMDILFPRGGEQNWAIEATPEPSLEKGILALIAAVRQLRGEEDANALLAKIVADRVSKMSKAMADQLAESPDRVGYRAACRKVVTSACRYGLGVLKGPLVDERTRKKWTLKTITETGQDGQVVKREAWVVDDTPVELRPYFRPVSVWDLYWDQTAKEIKDCRYIWEEYLMVYGDVLELAKRRGFDAGIIREYLRNNRDGDATERVYESELRLIGDKNTTTKMKSRFRVSERWGWLRGDELAECGVEMGDDPLEEDYFCNIWMIGKQIIKAVRSPIRGVEFPYYTFCIEKDESGICGDGIPRIMRDPQLALNAVIRAMLDNAALTSGPVIGVNKDVIAQGEDPYDIHAFRVLLFDDVPDMKSALAFWQAQSHTQEFLAMSKALEDFADDLTVPRWVHGDGNVADAAKTASGMSMLWAALSFNLAEMIKVFDDDITSQFIAALYHWNMDFNPRQDIKGDYSVVARGSTVLMAKEVQSQRLIQFMQLASQPEIASMVNWQKILREVATSMQLDPDIVLDEAAIQQRQMQQVAMQTEAAEAAKLKTLLNEMRARGTKLDDALRQLLSDHLMQAAQQQDQAAPSQTTSLMEAA